MKLQILMYFSLYFCFSITSYGQDPKMLIKTIIVDPGHGGKDGGASGAFSLEKDIALAISLKVYHKLASALSNRNIVITRSTDIYNDVMEKAEIANKAKGDLFICIHVDAAVKKVTYKAGTKKVPYYVTINNKKVKKYKNKTIYKTRMVSNPEPYGTSTYIWSNKKVDQKNEAIFSEGLGNEQDSLSNIPDLNTPEARLLSQAYTQKYFTRSKKMADLVEDEFTKIGRNSLGVKQRNNRGIWVLQQTAMPAILIETGFITNKQEEIYLNSEKGQEEMATAIVSAIKKYIISQEEITTDTSTATKRIPNTLPK
ncbi:MAG: N-acetylmuramoyl-L-alanine amidase family protein [Chitinophagaceae bacterium]